MKKILFIVLATGLFTSCGLYKKYERPDVNTSALVRDYNSLTDTLAVTDNSSFGNLEWRQVFTDPQLQRLIEQGLANNTDIKNAALSVEQVNAALKCARLAFLPSVYFSPSGTLSKVLTGDYKSDWSKSYSLPVSASWQIDAFGGILASKRGAEMNLAMTQDYLQAARSGVICGVANCYYTLLMLDKQLQILNDMQNLTKDTWDMMKLQKELGGARETSVASAEANYYSVQASIVDMKRQIRETENALSLLIGQQAQTIARGTLDNQSLPTQFSTGVGISILNNRPDVHAAEMNLANCFYSVQQARAKFYPSITISGTGSFTNSLGYTIANPGQLLASIVGSLTQPIFDNGRNVANLKVAKATYEQAYNTWQYQILSAGAEVSNALVLYNSSAEKAVADQHQVEVLTKNVGYTQDLFKMGSSTYLEVIGAQQSLLNAEISKVTDDFNKMQAVVNLYSALGGGKK